MIGPRLREARLAKKYTQEELAKLVNTKKTTISNYETGYSRPSPEMMNDLADILGVTTDYLYGRTDKPDGKGNQKEIIEQNGTYDSLAEINKLVKKYGVEDMGFFDIEEWKNLGPEDIRMLEEQFKLIVRLAKERNEEK